MYLCVYMLFSKMHYKSYLNSTEYLGISDKHLNVDENIWKHHIPQM